MSLSLSPQQFTLLYGGLQPVPLASQSYELASVAASAERLLNMYAEALPAGARSSFILKSTAGLQVQATLGTGPLLFSTSIPGGFFAISGSHAYVLFDGVGEVPIDLGSVGTCLLQDTVSIAVGLNAVVFCVPPNAFVSDFSGTPVSQITTGTGNFPTDGAGSVCYIDGYFVFSSYASKFLFLSGLLDATSYDSLDYVEISSTVDFIDFVVPHNGELWLFCESSIQVWYDTGQLNAPFQPRAGAVMPHGVGSARTVVEIDGSMFWLGIDKMIFRSEGYVAVRISNHAIEEVLANYDSGFLRGILACGFAFGGHAFYAISLPLAGPADTGITYVYDCQLGVWHERSSSSAGIGRWQINTASQLGARLLLGDGVNGNLYYMQASYTTENGVAVLRQAVLPPINRHGQRTFMARLEIEMEVGTAEAPGSINLDWSDDGGVTFPMTPRALSTGAVGATKTRVATNRLGSFRERVLRLQCASPCTIYGIDVAIAPKSAASI